MRHQISFGRNTRSPAVRFSVVALCFHLVFLQSALAFNYPLQPEEVRHAYSLGKTTNSEELISFYNKYVHYFPAPTGKSIISVQSVEFRTPYEQIVLRSRQNLNNYSPFQADEDYRVNPGLIVVRTIISYKTFNYVGPLPSADAFKFTVAQKETVEPSKITRELICDPMEGNACTATIFAILLWFDAEQFSSGKAQIKIETPDGQTIQARFDLDKLT